MHRPRFAEAEAQAQRGTASARSHTAREWRSRDVTPALVPFTLLPRFPYLYKPPRIVPPQSRPEVKSDTRRAQEKQNTSHTQGLTFSKRHIKEKKTRVTLKIPFHPVYPKMFFQDVINIFFFLKKRLMVCFTPFFHTESSSVCVREILERCSSKSRSACSRCLQRPVSQQLDSRVSS